MRKLISIKYNNQITIVNKIIEYNLQERVYIPINNLTKEYKINDYLYKYEDVGNYFLPISGIYRGISFKVKNQEETKCLVIENDFKENVLSKFTKDSISNIEELKKVLKKYKLQSILNKIESITNINNLVISTIDEERYSHKEFMCLTTHYHALLKTLDLLNNVLKVEKSTMVVKNTFSNAIKNIKSLLGTYLNITINLVPDKYLISYPIFLCEYLNYDYNTTLVLTTNELYALHRALMGRILSSQLITISGDAIEKGVVINTKIGTSLKDLLKELIVFKTKEYDIYVNGLIKGYLLGKEEDLVIDESVDYVVIQKKENKVISECINCGVCNKVCPMNINVKKYRDLKRVSKKCLKCGLCTYFCPSNIKSSSKEG